MLAVVQVSLVRGSPHLASSGPRASASPSVCVCVQAVLAQQPARQAVRFQSQVAKLVCTEVLCRAVSECAQDAGEGECAKAVPLI